MRNIADTNGLVLGKVYMVEMDDGEVHSFRIISETPTHYIFSFSTDDSIEVMEKAKNNIIGIFDVKEWWSVKGEKS